MKSKYLISAAAASAIIAGVGVSVTQTGDGAQEAAFLNPLMMANSICGDDAQGLSKRRAFFVRAANAYASAQSDEMNDGGAKMWSGVDAIGYEISTDKPEAQAWFNQGVAFTFGFNHEEAIKAFKKAQEIDPDCAMCYWGESFAYGPNINAPMSDEAVEPAYAAILKAISLSDGASAKEKALINALGYRYEAQPIADRSKLDNAFADAMDAVASQYSDDDFIASISAEANMDTQPWDYWADGGRTPKGRTARTISLIESVLARNPDYPAAIHLYIHITEASRNPYRAADFADRLAAIAPALGHLVHMPSHTYFRIGRFQESLDHNIKAVAADEAYLANADASILYEYGYFTHNIHFALTSAQMSGDKETAIAMAKKLDEKLPIDMAAAAPWVQPIKAAPYFAMAQFGKSDEILSAEDPGDALPFLKGAWHYARGEALARSGDLAAARAEAEAISALVANADLSALVNGGVPALDILNIAQLTVQARAAGGEGDFGTAVEAMEEAVALQESLAYTEPPYWYYPAKQTLAAMVLQAGDGERAEQLFLESLAKSPNNAWVLYGLSESYKAQGDKKAAKYAEALFKDAWGGDKKAGLDLSAL